MKRLLKLAPAALAVALMVSGAGSASANSETIASVGNLDSELIPNTMVLSDAEMASVHGEGKFTNPAFLTGLAGAAIVGGFAGGGVGLLITVPTYVASYAVGSTSFGGGTAKAKPAPTPIKKK